ncbi:MAG: hypothetical protein ACTSU5_10025 [Promethearchaeota archaeon]
MITRYSDFYAVTMKMPPTSTRRKTGAGPNPAPSRIYRVIEKSIQLFQRTGLDELASKWKRILHHYERSKKRSEILEQSTRLFQLNAAL